MLLSNFDTECSYLFSCCFCFILNHLLRFLCENLLVNTAFIQLLARKEMETGKQKVYCTLGEASAYGVKKLVLCNISVLRTATYNDDYF